MLGFPSVIGDILDFYGANPEGNAAQTETRERAGHEALSYMDDMCADLVDWDGEICMKRQEEESFTRWLRKVILL